MRRALFTASRWLNWFLFILLPVFPRAGFHSSSVTSPELSNSFVPESITDGGFKGVVGTVLGVFTNISIQRSLSK